MTISYMYVPTPEVVKLSKAVIFKINIIVTTKNMILNKLKMILKMIEKGDLGTSFYIAANGSLFARDTERIVFWKQTG